MAVERARLRRGEGDAAVIAMFPSGYHSSDYDPIERAVNLWLPTGLDVWLHNPWGHRTPPMKPAQWWDAQREGWSLGVNESRWEAAIALMKYHGRRVVPYIGGPHVLRWYQWRSWRRWVDWLTDQTGVIGFDAAYHYEPGSNGDKECERLAARGVEIIIEPTPLTRLTNLYGYGRAMREGFYRDINRPTGMWAKTVRGETYRLMTHMGDAPEVQLAIDDCRAKGHIPVVPIKYLERVS